jgi:hypothetical protein
MEPILPILIVCKKTTQLPGGRIIQGGTRLEVQPDEEHYDTLKSLAEIGRTFRFADEDAGGTEVDIPLPEYHDLEDQPEIDSGDEFDETQELPEFDSLGGIDDEESGD